MRIKSKIKSIFKSKQLLERLAAICDTNTIENNQLKMDLVQRLLNREGIKSAPCGGATNRYVVNIDGYAIKIAVDDQGYKDNLMEYALTLEMPHTQDSYETNGYILCQDLGRAVSVEEWKLRKTDIRRKLDELGREFLLGDVGYSDINITNWVVDDDGDVKLCDYAYCHRLTENLFTCPVCGSLLAYDENCNYLLCTDRANCHEKYSYNDIKAIQGNEIDWQMINEVKSKSIQIPDGKTYIDIDVDDAVRGNVFIVKSYRDLYLFNKIKEEEEENMVQLDYNNPEVINLLRELAIAQALGETATIAQIENEISDMTHTLEHHDIECIIDPDFQERMERDRLDNEEAMIYEQAHPYAEYEDDRDNSWSIDELLRMADEKDHEEDYYYDEGDSEEDTESMSISVMPGTGTPLLTEEVVISGNPIKEHVNNQIVADSSEEVKG